MAHTAQMIRPKEATSNWSSTFPDLQNSQSQSTIFMKKLLAVAVSEILYLRAIFPEKAFGDRKVEDLSLKILSETNSLHGPKQVIQWMKGCFEALEKKYLRQIQLAVYLNENEPDKAVESYNFRFDYHDNKTSITCNDKEVGSSHSAANIRKATLSLLRTTVLLTQHLNPLPNPAYLGMKLLYYDDVTPHDYEPEGFKSCDVPTYSFIAEPVNMKVGEVNTIFHSMKLRVKTDRTHFEDDDEFLADQPSIPSPDINLDETESIITEHEKTSEKNAMECDYKQGTSRQTLKKENQNTNPVKSVMSEESHSTSTHVTDDGSHNTSPQAMDDGSHNTSPHVMDDENHNTSLQTMESAPSTAARPESPDPASDISESFRSMGGQVRCPCNDSEDDGLMIQCMDCGYWQHGICFAVKNDTDSPKNHYCHLCADENNPKRTPTDFYLHSLDAVEQQKMCIWRRTLLTCLELRSLTEQHLNNKLDIPIEEAKAIMGRLEKEGFIINADKSRQKNRKLIKKDAIKSVAVPRYLVRQKTKISPSKFLQNNIPQASAIVTNHQDSEILTLVKNTEKLSVLQTKPDLKNTRSNSKRKQLFNLGVSLNDSQDTDCLLQNTSQSSKKFKSSSSSRGLQV